MTKRKRIGTDLRKLDAHVITPEEYEDIPELTDEWFARGTLHIGGVPVKRGRKAAWLQLAKPARAKALRSKSARPKRTTAR